MENDIQPRINQAAELMRVKAIPSTRTENVVFYVIELSSYALVVRTSV